MATMAGVDRAWRPLGQVKPLPAVVLDLIMDSKEEGVDTRDPKKTDFDKAPDNYAAAALKRESERVASTPSGARNDTLNRASRTHVSMPSLPMSVLVVMPNVVLRASIREFANGRRPRARTGRSSVIGGDVGPLPTSASPLARRAAWSFSMSTHVTVASKVFTL